MSDTFSPRTPQREARSAVIAAWKSGQKRPCVILPTGVGKTGLYLWIVAEAARKGHRVIVIAHRGELLDQPLASLRRWYPDVAADAGIVKAEADASGARVVFASIQTIQNEGRLARVLSAGPPALVVVDEAHHSTAPTWRAVLDRLAEAGRQAGREPHFLAVTATPERADGREIGALWEACYFYPLLRAISEGYLVPPRFIVERLPEASTGEALDMSRYAGLSEDEIGQRLVLDGIVEHTVNAILRHGAGRKLVTFTASVEQARLTAEALNAAGRKARYLTGTTGRAERARLIKALKSGGITDLCNCGVLTEGFDDPTVGGVVIARPTSSKSLYIQCVGRALRICPEIKKVEGLILDLAGASEEHDLTQAPVLLNGGVSSARSGSGREDDDEAVPDEAGVVSDPYAGLWRERKKHRPVWIGVEGYTRRVKGVDCGEHGVILTVRHPSGWRALYAKDDAVRDLSPTLLTGSEQEGDLSELVSDLARRAEQTTKKQRRGAWTEAPSLKQVDLLNRLGVKEIPKDRGHASALISVHKAARRFWREIERPLTGAS